MSRLITSFQNPLIRNLLLLEEKPRERKKQHLIVIEGQREIRLALSAGFTVTTLFYCPDFMDNTGLNALVHISGSSMEMIELPAEIYNRLAYRKDHEGAIALAHPRRLLFHDLKLRRSPLILVLESVEKPGNLGAILRTADAASLDAVIICDPQTDIFNPNAIRSSIGCIFTVPVITSTSEHTIHWLKEKNIRIVATALTASHFYHETDFRQPAAIIMGSEAQGLTDLWLNEADNLIKIPMSGKIDSMNVSASAAVVVFEALRQRGFSGHAGLSSGHCSTKS